MEFLSQYETHFIYIQGDRNTVADALSRRPNDEEKLSSLQAEQKAQQPYFTPSTEESDDVTCVFSLGDDRILSVVAVLSDVSFNNVPHSTFTISADKDFLTLL